MKAKLANFPNLGFLIDDVPKNILKSLNQKISEANIDVSNMLAGNISKEYDLLHAKDLLESYLIELFHFYNESYNYTNLVDQVNQPVPITLNNLWVNFQERGEFNPSHKHSGIMSFVIWLDIPYDIKEESKDAGTFEFVYTDILGNTIPYKIPVDKNFNGKIIMFPNRLMHSVYPYFSTEKQRITIAGNLALDVKSTKQG